MMLLTNPPCPTAEELSTASALDETQARVIWSLLIEPGDADASRFADQAGGWAQALELVLAAPDDDGVFYVAKGFESRFEAWRSRTRDLAEQVRRLWDRLERFNIHVVTPEDDADWPKSLLGLAHDAPIVLYGIGDIDLLRSDCISIVGARAATGYGEHATMELASGLVARGFTVVSGGAYGIDGTAHRVTLASGGRTIAVMSGGVDRFYPAGHEDLLQRVAASGLVVSELPPSAAPTKWRFLQRNRIIAALGQATIVVEAGLRSGSLNTAGHAVALGRPLGAVPGAITSAASKGCHRLLREYGATCVTSADEVVELALS